MAKFQVTGKKKAFTLIEMLVTTGIILVISTTAVLGFKPATGTTAVVNGAQEIKSLVEELQSFAVGPERERATHYILIIQNSGTGNYCNNSLDSTGIFKQYMICATTLKDITNANLDTDFNRVIAGHLETNVGLNSSDITAFNNAYIINARTYDSQLGFNLLYKDSTPPSLDSGNITVSSGTLTKQVNINALLNTVTIP